jgi:sulfatase maturation enzyme AslB (radical SAM superfamily)
LTNEKYAKVLTDLSTGDRSGDVKSLIDLKFIVPEGFDQQKVFDAIGNSLLKKKPCPGISYVLVTDFCNFRCGYCFIENSLKGPNISMSKDLADKVINVLINAAKEVKEYRVTFYGGEPP